jgi:glutamyl-tRNA synthetase
LTEKPVRVRFAPSPTGPLHIGGARTALFNWLLARHSGGVFILRIEDTDQGRSKEGSLEEIMTGLRWLGLEWDEGPDIGGPYGPYVQSERSALYQEWANWLVENGKAYRCYATPEEIKANSDRLAAEKGRRIDSGYLIAGAERVHRFISDEERAKLAAERGEKHVIRLAMPLDGEILVQDAIRGEISFPNEELSDIVLLKSDGFPTYHLAMAVDDHFMEISHVMRSDEWLPSLPMHYALYDAFGWQAPIFVHLPVILSPKGGKLSKREISSQEGEDKLLVQVKEYIEEGYLPQAVVNWLTNTGWSFGEDREIFSVEETIERFTLDRLSPAGTKVNFSKLENLNGHYIRLLSLPELHNLVHPILAAAYGNFNEAKLTIILPHVQPRLNPIKDIVPLLEFLFRQDFQPPAPEDLIQKGMDAQSTQAALERVYATLDSLPDFDAATQESAARALVEELGIKTGQLFNTIRWATTAQRVSPPLFDSMEALGKAETLARLRQSIEIL